MKVKWLIIGLVVCFNFRFVQVGMAQGSNQILDIPKVTPPSPNAASLGKYGDIPVSLYTGIPNISIPLYTITVGKFSLPISLSYHSQGLKVEERAGWVGLGWSLNAGGVITRTVHGLADEVGGGFWNYPNWTADTVAASETILANVCAGSFYDLQPDMFFYNFGAYSGKFVMDQTPAHQAHFIPFNNFQLTHQVDLTGLSQFQMTDDNGIIYIFGAVESTVDADAIVLPSYNSSWYITQIITPAGNINFTYTPETTTSVQFTETDYLNTAAGSDANQYNPGYSGSYRYLTNNSVILSSISFPTGTITFNTAANRLDFGGASAITGLTVSDIHSTPQHKFVFSESYFGNTSLGVPEAVRLKLDTVTEVSVTDSTQKKTYVLTYNNPAQVPSVKSLGQDSWGFYNGQDNNKSLLPYIDPAVYGAFIANQAASYHGNLTPSASYAQTGVLQSIQYPTGGTSQFIYEGNDYGTAAGNPVEYYPTVTGDVSAYAGETGLINIPTIDTVSFSTNVGQNVTVNVKGSYTGVTPAENGPTLLLNQVNTDGSRTNLLTMYEVNSTSNQPVSLSAGVNYELIASVDGPGQTMQGQFNYTWVDTTLTIVKSSTTGGLRIQQIINTDPISGQTNTKTYKYYSPSDTTKSSGNLTATPIYLDPLYSFTWNTSYDLISSSSLNYLGSMQGSHIAYSTVTEIDGGAINNGKKVSYFNASDFPNSNSSLYYSVYPGLLQIPRTPNQVYRYMTDYDVYRGLLTKEVTYNSANTIVKQSIYNYSLGQQGSPNYYAMNAVAGYSYQICHTNCPQCLCTNAPGSSGCASCSMYSLENYTLANYQIVCPWIYKTSTVDTVYDTNGANPVGVTTNYYYDNPVHGLVTRTTTINSKGDTLETVNKYAGDQGQINGLTANASNALTTMVSMNKIAPVIEMDHYNNSTLLNLLRTDYQVWDATHQVVEPQHIWYQTASNPIEDRLDFYQYDTCSNPLEAAKATDAHHSYVWDYKNQLAIAEVQNAHFSDIAYTSFEADGFGNWTLGGGSADPTTGFTGASSYVLNGGNISKSGLNSASTYIVSYWTQNNNSFNIAGTISGYPVQGKTIGGWTLFVHKVTGQTTITLSGSGHIDELRLYPSTALMTTYTYAPLTGLTSQCDMGNRVTYYEYDGLQRLKRIRDQDHNILKQYDYQYQAPTSYTFYNNIQIQSFTCSCGSGGVGSTVYDTVQARAFSSTISVDDANTQANNYLQANGQAYANAHGICTYYNTVDSGSYTKNNCSCMYTGSSVTYTVPAGTYSSTVSLAAANQLAINDVNANGQNYANTNGTCTTTCISPMYKISGCSCMAGTYEVISQYQTGSGSTFQCVTNWGYLFSDGTYIITSTTSDGGYCP